MPNQAILDELLERVLKMTDEEVEKFIEEMQARESQIDSSEPEIIYMPQQVYQPNQNTEESNVSDAFDIKNGNIYYWRRSPHTFFVSCKPDDDLCEQIFKEIIDELKRCHITVVVAPGQAQQYGCVSYESGRMNAGNIDITIVVGGDGSLLYVSQLFQTTCPPVVSFNAGSLGFLAPFPSINIQAALQQVLNGPLVVTNRHRLNAYITGVHRRRTEPQGDADSVQSTTKSTTQTTQLQRSSSNPNIISLGPLSAGSGSHPANLSYNAHSAYPGAHSGLPLHGHSVHQQTLHSGSIPEDTNRFLFPVQRYQCPLGRKVYTSLNEVYLYRQGNYMTNLQCYAQGYYFGTIQADGLLVSTPTGSTAHALSAGGVPVHPDVGGVLVTPICPHVMSSKQLLLPEYPLKVKVSMRSRGDVLVCFDGKDSTPLSPGQSVIIYKAPYDLLTVALTNCTVDWFFALKRCLNWNVRIEQKQMKKHGSDQIDEKIREVGDLDSDLE